MKGIHTFLTIIILSSCLVTSAQTKSTQKLHEKYEDAFTMFFYKSTLKMLAGDDHEEFKDMIKGIEKAKLLRIEKTGDFNESDVNGYLEGIKKESFEEIMTIRQGRNNMVVFLKEDDGETEGVVVLVNEEESFNILDIVGSVDLSKITMLTKQIDF